jgi:hypothetical protein
MVYHFFSLKAGSSHDEGMGATPEGLSRVSIGEIWLSIDQLDKAGHEGISAFAARSPWRGLTLHTHVNFRGSERMGEGTSHAARGASIDEALGSSSTPQKGCGGGSTKNNVARILLDAVEAIPPRMR